MTTTHMRKDQERSPRALAGELGSMSTADIKELVRRLLEIPPTVVDDLPYLRLVETYDESSVPTQIQLNKVLEQLLKDLVERPDTWNSVARRNLMATLQRCGHGVLDSAQRAATAMGSSASRRNGLTATERGVLAGLLKALIKYRRCMTPIFWHRQGEALGPRYGALIFAGLSLHSLKLAMSHLPKLAADPAAGDRAAVLLPELVSRHGEEAVVRELRPKVGEIPETSRAPFALFLDRATDRYPDRQKVQDVSPEGESLKDGLYSGEATDRELAHVAGGAGPPAHF